VISWTILSDDDGRSYLTCTLFTQSCVMLEMRDPETPGGFKPSMA
jgi:hypothetical protein